jgi:hypothetical protein
MVRESDLACLAGEYVDHGARRHVAFVVLEELLHAAPADEVTFTVTVSRRSGAGVLDGCVGFTAAGQVAELGV